MDSKKRSEGHVRLPLFGVHRRHLYPAMPDDVVWREHDIDTGEGVPNDAVQVLLPSGEEFWMV